MRIHVICLWLPVLIGCDTRPLVQPPLDERAHLFVDAAVVTEALTESALDAAVPDPYDEPEPVEDAEPLVAPKAMPTGACVDGYYRCPCTEDGDCFEDLVCAPSYLCLLPWPEDDAGGP